MNSKQKYLKEEYISRINKAIDYIDSNLEEDLNLENISKAAGFSVFHFHRIFKVFINETINNYVKRLRTETAAKMLAYNPKESITKIAFRCGFSSSQSFARSFKECFKSTPSQFREENMANSKNCYLRSKNWKDLNFNIDYDEIKGRHKVSLINPSKINIIMKVEIKDMPDTHVAYVRRIGSYKADDKVFTELFCKICDWAGPRGLLNESPKMLSVYYDDPKITDEAKLRLDVCLVVPENTKVEGEIGKQTLLAGKYAIARFEMKDPSEYGKAWDALYGEWLPESGFQPDNRPSYEVYLNDPNKHPKGIHIVDICVPVKPL